MSRGEGSLTRGVHSLLYFAYTCVRDLFIGGVIYLAEKFIRWWYFPCKKRENIICDGILHVNMFHYFKIPYFTCTFFSKFIYNEYIGPYFLSHVVSKIFASEPPEVAKGMCLPTSYNLELYYEISGFRNMDAFVARSFCILLPWGRVICPFKQTQHSSLKWSHLARILNHPCTKPTCSRNYALT